MWFSYVLIVLGIVAAANLVVSKIPSAKEYIVKMAPYQGWLGVFAVVAGVWNLIDVLTHLGVYTQSIVLFLFVLLVIGLLLSLGFIVGIGTVKPFIKNEKAQEKITALLNKLTPVQGILGIAGIVVGILLIVLRIVLRAAAH